MTHALTTGTVLVAMVAACASPSVLHAQAMKTDSAGVEIVNVPTGDRSLGWTFERIMSAGGVEDDAFILPELDARHIAVNDAGRVFVLDWIAGTVLVIEPTGQPGTLLGRKGRGPGELTVPRGIDVAADGSVLVSDPAKRAFVRWDASGKLLSEKPLVVSPFGGKLRATETGVMMRIRDSKSRETRMKLARVTGDSAVDLASQTWPPTHPPTYASCPGYSVESPPFFWPWLLWDANGGYTAVVNSERYEIDVFHHDRLVRIIRRDIRPIEVTDAVIDEEVESITVRGCTIPGAERARVLGHQPVLPVIADVAIGPDGHIWVHRHIPGPESDKIDLLTIEGDYVGTLLSGEPFPVGFAGEDRIVELTKDSLDVAVIRTYRVDRKN